MTHKQATAKVTGAPAAWTRKDLIAIRDLSAEELTLVLDMAAAFKQVGAREIKKVPALRGKTLVNFCRAEHADADVVRAGRVPAERGRSEHLGEHVEPFKG